MKQLVQLPLAVQLPDDETFDSFVSKINQNIVSQLKQLVEIKYNNKGFYLFGPHGAGKSHLLHASCVFAEKLSKSSLCLSFSELQYLSVEVLDGLEQIDVVCLDDIQLIAGNDAWEQAVFDLFNRMTEHDRLMIISSTQSVQNSGLNLPDLVSRLSWGFVEQIKTLSDQDKISAFQFRAKQRGLILQEDAVKFLFNRISREMKYLLNCLEQLDNASIREQRKITIPFIKEVLQLN